jgi:hypothetical protein
MNQLEEKICTGMDKSLRSLTSCVERILEKQKPKDYSFKDEPNVPYDNSVTSVRFQLDAYSCSFIDVFGSCSIYETNKAIDQ